MEEKWKKAILERLQERNNKQREAFATLIYTHNKLQQDVETYKTKSVQLTVEVERLKQETLELQIKGGNGGGGGKNSEKTLALEQKVFKLQEELTELHRKKGENSQQIIDLNTSVQDKDKELQAKNARIRELEEEMERYRAQEIDVEQSMMELTTTNQMLTDEQQALQLAFTSLEQKFRKMQEDNNDLVSRWMELKSKDANKLNKSNEEFIQKKQAKMQQQLAEAASTQVHVTIPQGAVGPAICFNVTIPNVALAKFDGHEGEVNCVKWSPSGRIFATGAADRKVKLWEVISGKCEQKGVLMGSNAAIMSIDYDTEENWVLGASNDFASRVWTLSDQRLRHTLTGHSGKVLAAKFFGDASKVVSGSHDRTLKIWDLRRIACIKTIFAGSSCNDLVTNDATNIISGHFDRKIRFWDTRSETSSKEIGLQGRITSLDLAPDRTTLLGCSRDDSIKLIDLRMNQVIGTLSADGFHVGCDWTRAVFSPDGAYVMAGSNDGSLFVWNVAKQRMEKVLKEHMNGIISCSWHPNGNSLLSCDKQRKVILWSDF